MTDLISRADAIEAVRKELVCDGRHEAHDKTCRFIADVLLSALPSAEQVTGKLKNPCDSLLKSDSDECKEQKSKLDLISRADAIEAVRLETGKLGRWLLGRGDILDIISALPSAETTGALDDAITKYVADGLMEFPSAEAVQGVGRYENAIQKLREMPRYLNGIKKKQITKISAEVVPLSTELFNKLHKESDDE